MNLISDFLLYCSCYEIPRNYAIYSALGLLGAAFNRRVYFLNGDRFIFCPIYCTLVGKQGVKKSTPIDLVRELYHETYPEIPVAPSVQSREDIIRFMASEKDIFHFFNEQDVEVEYHPYMFFINEFDMFISYNPAGMVSFLVDVHDRVFYSGSTIKRNLEQFPNPSVNFLAACVPDWLTTRLRGNIISGGLCRRMIFVVEDHAKDEKGDLICIPCPIITDEAKAARKRIVDHLLATKKLVGQFKTTALGELFYNEWYIKNKLSLPSDPFLEGYRSSKDIQLRKVAMLLDLSTPSPGFKFTDELLVTAKSFLDDIEVNMTRLSIAAGRNELAAPQQALIDMLETRGGIMSDKEWRREADKNMSFPEYMNAMRYFKDTGQVFPCVIMEGSAQKGVITTAVMYARLLKENKVVGNGR